MALWCKLLDLHCHRPLLLVVVVLSAQRFKSLLLHLDRIMQMARLSRPQQTLHVRLCGTSDCWIAFGPTPVAAVNGAGSILLPAGVPEYFWVYPGEFVACIQASAVAS